VAGAGRGGGEVVVPGGASSVTWRMNPMYRSESSTAAENLER
jgi:hypothetical protein